MLKLFLVGTVGTILADSFGIDSYSHIDSKNIEDIEKDKFAFAWFVSTLVLAVVSAIVGTLLMLFVPYVSPNSKEYGWIWSLILNGLAIISSAFAWDLSTRSKTNLEEISYKDRKFFIFLTILFIILFFVSIYYIPFRHSE